MKKNMNLTNKIKNNAALIIILSTIFYLFSTSYFNSLFKHIPFLKTNENYTIIIKNILFIITLI